MFGVGKLVESVQRDLQHVPTLPSNCTLYRVPAMLRGVKPEDYTPHLVAIGPYHRSKQSLKNMESHKLHYLNEFLRRNSRVTLVDYVNGIAGLEEKARKCYSETIYLGRDNFIKMLLLDGCFILELFLRRDRWEQYRADPLLNKTWMSRAITRDLILLENQIPLFVLRRLKTLLNRGNSEARATRLEYLGRTFFAEIMLRRRDSFGVLRASGDGEPVDVETLPENEEASSGHSDETQHLLDFVRNLHLPSSTATLETHGRFSSIHSATELHDQSKVNFKSGSQTCLFEITFHRQVLSIPPIKIGDCTESLLRNLIAFEQCHSDCSKHFTAYAALMDGLTASSKDVELLQKNKIIDNFIGRPEKVCELFNELLEGATLPLDNFYFSGICEEVETYYEMIKASKRNYALFNSSAFLGLSKRSLLLLIIVIVVLANYWRSISR